MKNGFKRTIFHVNILQNVNDEAPKAFWFQDIFLHHIRTDTWNELALISAEKMINMFLAGLVCCSS